MLTREEFIKCCLLLGLGTMMPSRAISHQRAGSRGMNKDGRKNSAQVIVVGAGAAGMMAAYALKQQDVDVIVLEASSRFGGRVKKLEGFTDFPLDLGAEWIHTEPQIFNQLTRVSNTDQKIETIEYNPKSISIWHNHKLKNRDFFSRFYSEYKFKHSTWWDFFNQFIEPSISEFIHYQQPVTHIDYSKRKILVKTANKDIYYADRVIVATPISVLKRHFISFIPALPLATQQAFNQVDMPDGLKLFMKFSKRFYPDLILEGGLIENFWLPEQGEKTLYDAAFKKESSEHVLGLFCVGEPARVYAEKNNQALIEYVLKELDLMFDQQASKYFLEYVAQNWSREPYIWGSYSHYKNYEAQDVLRQSLDHKLFFAGEAYAVNDQQATVHGAGLSGANAVQNLLLGV